MQHDQAAGTETKLDRIIRYMNLMLAKWKIEEELDHEYPDEMHESRKKLAQIMLKYGAVKCEHEK